MSVPPEFEGPLCAAGERGDMSEVRRILEILACDINKVGTIPHAVALAGMSSRNKRFAADCATLVPPILAANHFVRSADPALSAEFRAYQNEMYGPDDWPSQSRRLIDAARRGAEGAFGQILIDIDIMLRMRIHARSP